MEVEERLNTDRLAMLEEQLNSTTARLQRLAGLRAEYSNLVAEVDSRASVLQRAEQTLAEARFSQATARATSLIGRVDQPQTGANPLGPGRAAILLAGLMGGLLAGAATMFLTLPPAPLASYEPAETLDDSAVCWTVALAGNDLRLRAGSRSLDAINGNGAKH
jgi:hypothetical protein